MILSADHAIPLGILVNELVTNAFKYAYPGDPGAIRVSANEIDGRLHVEISDQGVGLPEGFDINQPRRSLGFKVVVALVRKLNGRLTVSQNLPSGARFKLDMPLLNNSAPTGVDVSILGIPGARKGHLKESSDVTG